MTKSVQTSKRTHIDQQVKDMEKRMVAVANDMLNAKKMLIDGRKEREETYKDLQSVLTHLEDSFTAYEKDLKDMSHGMAKLNKNLRKLDHMMADYLTKPETE